MESLFDALRGAQQRRYARQALAHAALTIAVNVLGSALAAS